MDVMRHQQQDSPDGDGADSTGARDVFSLRAGTAGGVSLETTAAPALFGPDVKTNRLRVSGPPLVVWPAAACTPLSGAAAQLSGKIAVVKRGSCMFVEKVKNCQDAGALAVVIYNDQNQDPTLLTMNG